MPYVVGSMSLSLYQDAIIEAKQLKEAAEQNAKNRIIEALTPQIQLMIEQQLTDEFEEDVDVDVDDDFEDAPAMTAPTSPTEPAPTTTVLDLGSMVSTDGESAEAGW